MPAPSYSGERRGLLKDHPQKESFSPAPRAEPTRVAHSDGHGAGRAEVAVALGSVEEEGLPHRGLCDLPRVPSRLSYKDRVHRRTSEDSSCCACGPRPQAATKTPLCSSTGLSRQRTHTKAKRDHTCVPRVRSRLGSRAPCTWGCWSSTSPPPPHGESKQSAHSSERRAGGGQRPAHPTLLRNSLEMRGWEPRVHP